jgi:hypothetical protein
VCVCVCRHWADFRAKHGWADEELVDAYGDAVERTDGGRRVLGKKGMMPPHVKARSVIMHKHAQHSIGGS